LLDIREVLAPTESPDEMMQFPFINYHKVSELMLVGTGFCIAGVRRLSKGSLYRDYKWPGPVYRKLLAAWSELVNVDIAGQFISS
jgi:hypothetical protein